MKIRSVLQLSCAALLLCSCLVKSIHPFYTEKDVKMDMSLIGSWLDQDSSLWKISQYKVSKGMMRKGDTLLNSYKVEFHDDKTINVFEAHLFELNGEKYMDFTPLMDEYFDGEFYSVHLINSHSLAKLIKTNTGEIKLQWFNEEWLSDLIKEKKLKIPHEIFDSAPNSESILLTGSTQDLQKFILKHGNDPDAHDCENGDGICFNLSRLTQIN